MVKKTKILLNISRLLKYQKNKGYTLIEILVTLAVFGILTAIAAPTILQQRGESTAEIDGKDQFQGILQKVRNGAIASTSAMRITPDPDQPNNKFLVEIAQTRGCNSVTKLSEDAVNTADIKVLSSAGFNVGDVITVGGAESDILGTPDAVTLTLGAPISKPKDAVVELADNWSINSRIGGNRDDVTLPEDKRDKNNIKPLATFTADIPNWTMCVNGRGIVYILDANNTPKNSLTLTFKNVNSKQEETITINQGGAISN
ncbi:pilus assembly FimT family protein [Geminocystis herdmanii]|uniref:pilus assembly FimT family protein n=1 Tax=Geminocystis herdmanii TaxID=669359 RepID=UPI000345B56A|nr:type II secretion system protein [Geminocystis herdmanii]